MITNLIASVTFMLVTNTSEIHTDYELREWSGHEPGCHLGCLLVHTRGVNPTAKTVTTEINLLSIATFKFQGESYTVTNSKSMDRTVKRFVKQTEWVEAQANSIGPVTLEGLVITNFVGATNNYNPDNYKSRFGGYKAGKYAQ
jgi:hypothetical protein